MSWNTIKRRKSDIDFSNYIREKAGWKCEYCGRVCKIGDLKIAQLEASHYFSRSHENTRFDICNVYSMCSSCHKRLGGHRSDEKGEYDVWVKERLKDGYTLLKIRSSLYKKRDDVLDLMYVRELVKEL